MRTSTRLSALAALVAIGFTTACGTSGSGGTTSADPKTAITASITKLTDHRSVTFSIHFTDPNGTLKKAMTSGSSGLPGVYASRIIGDEIRITEAAPAGKTLAATQIGSGARNDVAFSVIDQGSPLLDVRFIFGDLYLRLDVAKLRDLAGGGVTRLLTGLGQFSPALAAGNFVKIPAVGKTFSDLLSKHAGGIVPKPATSAQTQQFVHQLSAALQNVVTFTSKGNGQYGFAVDAKAAANAFFSVLTANSALFGPAVAGLGAAQTKLAKIPSGNVTGTVTVKDGSFSSIAVDLQSIVALARTASPSATIPALTGAELVISATESSDGLTAPANSTPLDISQILGGLLGSISGSRFSTSSAPITVSPT